MGAINREFALVTACCLWPPSPARNQAIASAAAAGEIDWARFARVVKRHRVPGLVWNGLSQAAIDLPADSARQLKNEAAQTARAGLALCGEAVQLQGLFDRAGVSCTFMKGVTLAKLAYGDIGIRHAKDIDISVSDADFAAASALLLDAGYRRTKPASDASDAQLAMWRRHGKDWEWRHDGKGIELELHWRLSTLKVVDNVSSPDTPLRPINIAGNASLTTLPELELFAYLCVHGASHAWSRLKWLADVNALLTNRPPAMIETYYQFAKDRNVERPMGQALLLCARLFGLKLPESIETELAGSLTISLAAKMAVLAMMRGGAEVEFWDLRFGSTLPVVSHFLIVKGWRELASEVFKKSINLDDTISVPLPVSLSFLYPILRWPLWCVRRFSSGGISPLK